MTWERTPELISKITGQLADGTSLVKICKEEGMPSLTTLTRWQDEDESFGLECARARMLCGDRDAEKINDINDKLEKGLMEPQVASVISSNLKWTASKHAPKKYGDKIDHNVGGEAKFTIEIVKLGTPLIEA